MVCKIQFGENGSPSSEEENHVCVGLGNGQEQCTDSECGIVRIVSNHVMCSWAVLSLVNTPG